MSKIQWLKFISIVFLIAFVATGYSQAVLVDDAPMCGHHDRTTYNALWDSLASAGASISYTTIEGRSFSDIESYDMLIIMHHNRCSSAGFSDSQRDNIIQYVCSGGNVIIMPIIWDDLGPINQLLNDSRWNTGIYYSNSGGFIHTTNIADFSPYTDDVTHLHFEISALMITTLPAYPFAWDEDGEHVVASISYPTSTTYPDCDCDEGGRILAIADNHTFEAPVVGYIEPMNHKFIVNTMLAMAGILPLPDCEMPPGIPSAAIDTCLSPGESFTITGGTNLYAPMTMSIGGIPVEIESFSSDSTEITFTCPDFIQGSYNVKIHGEGRAFIIGNLRIFCEWVQICSFSDGCFMPGDTVYFTGENFSVTGGLISLISPDYTDTTTLDDFYVESSTEGWFVIPTDIDTTLGGYFKMLFENTDIGNSDIGYFRLPCPCPAQRGLYGEYISDSKPMDTKTPEINIDPLDSCLYLSMGSGEIVYSTSIDSFMSVPTLWSERNPTNPIDIYFSEDGGSTWLSFAMNQTNTGSFFWTPADTGSDYSFIISATDSFGNTSSDTIDVCVTEFDVPPYTGILRSYESCDPESLVFTIRDSSMTNMATLAVDYNRVHYEFPDSMRWTNDTTLVFYLPAPFPDSTSHWLRISEMTSTTTGIRIEPDIFHGLGTVFNSDYTRPEISPLYPPEDTLLDMIPEIITVLIQDWSGIEDTSIWVSVNDDTFYIPVSGLNFTDSILAIDLESLGADYSSHYEICIRASDADYPIECTMDTVYCYGFSVSMPPHVEYLSPSDTVITSCRNLPIHFFAFDDTEVDWTTVELNVNGETGITYSDSRVSVSHDTLIFNPEEDWESCMPIFAMVTALEDNEGISAIDLPASGSFMIDTEPPTFSNIRPMGSIVDPITFITVDIDDNCTNIDPSSIEMTIDGTAYSLLSAGMSWSGGVLSFNLDVAGLSIESFDTITVCVAAADSALLCGANEDSICWQFDYHWVDCDISVEAFTDDDTICSGSSTSLTATASSIFSDVSYLWLPDYNISDNSSPNPVVSPDTSVYYVVIAVDDSGCTAEDTVYIEVLPLPDINISDTIVCRDSIVTITVESGYESYEWSNGSTVESTIFTASYDSALYWLEVSEMGCVKRDTFKVSTINCDSVICEIMVSAVTVNDSICEGDSITLSANVEGNFGLVNYLWTPDQWISDNESQHPIVFPSEDIVYTVIATDSAGCFNVDSVAISVIDCTESDDTECLAHPNPFTPDGNSINDYGKLEYPGMQENRGVAFIYSLENELLKELRNGDDFESVDGAIYWNGEDSGGNLMKNGPYLYIIQVDDKTVCKGTIYIAR